MEKIHGNMHVCVLSCKFLTSKHKNMRVSMYFLYLVLTFTPHYIITDKGQLCLQAVRVLLYVHVCSMHVLTCSTDIHVPM